MPARPVKDKEVLLLLFLNMQRAPAKPRAEFLKFQLLATRLATDRIVIVAGLFANEENCFDFFL